LQDIVLSGTECKGHFTMADMFVGKHVTYPVGECKLVSDIKRLGLLQNGSMLETILISFK
jgi:hypothetical protein